LPPWSIGQMALKNKLTYEIMDAQLIGLTDNQLMLTQCAELAQGIEVVVETELNKAFLKFKDLADKKKEISDWDLETSRMMKSIQPGNISLRVEVSCGDRSRPTATVTCAPQMVKN